MIDIKTHKNGTIAIVPSSPDSPAKAWLSALFRDEYFASVASDKSIFPPPSNDEEINEEWEEFSIPDLISSCSSLRKKFSYSQDGLVFDRTSSSELAAFVNMARLKIAMDGTTDALPPSGQNPRRDQYEFFTALLEIILQIDRFLKPQSQS